MSDPGNGAERIRESVTSLMSPQALTRVLPVTLEPLQRDVVLVARGHAPLLEYLRPVSLQPVASISLLGLHPRELVVYAHRLRLPR
jgi:hypothetical protein